MSSDNDLSNNDVNDDSGNDFEFVHVPNNGLIPATNVVTNWGEDGMNSGAKKLRTYYYPPIKNTGFYDSSGNDIGHLFTAGGSNVDSSYNGIAIWKASNIAGEQYDSNSNSTFYNQYFSNRTENDGEVGPHVQFGAYDGAYKWGKSSEGAHGIQSSDAEWIFDIPTINTITGGEQRAKKAVAYIVSSGGSCTGSTTVYRGKYNSSDGSSGAYGVGKFDIGSSTTATLYLARDNRDNTYVKIGDKKCSIKNGDGGAQRRWESKSGKDVHQVGSNTSDYSNLDKAYSDSDHDLISLGKNIRKGVNKVDFPDGHPKFNSNTGRGSGNNSDKPGFVGAIQVHFFWD